MLLIYIILFGLLSNLATACIDCSEDMARGKLSFSTSPDEDFPKVVALPSPGLMEEQQQKVRFLPKSFAPRVPSNMLHVYTLLRGPDPRITIADDYFQDPSVSRLKKSEKGMLVDVMDFVTKSDDRNRRVGQNMRSSG